MRLPASVRLCGLAGVSALLLLLAFPPFDLGLLALMALVPWLLALRIATRRQAFQTGIAFGFVYGLGQMYFIDALTAKWTGNSFTGMIPWLLAAAAFSLYFGWAAVLMRKAMEMRWDWAIPFLWAGIELIRSYIPVFAFPWGLLATPLWKHAFLIQGAYYGTIFLMSAWVVAVNLLLIHLWLKSERRGLQPMVILVAIGPMMAFNRYLSFDGAPLLKVTAIQPGVDMAFTPPIEVAAKLHAAIQPAIDRADADGTELLVLPEGIADGSRMPPTLPFRPGSIPFVIGGRRGTGPVYQSAFAFDGKGYQYADKTRLVVFGEFVPGRELFPFIARTFRLPTGDMSAGTEGIKALDIAGTRVGPMVCFEELFPDIAYRQAANGARCIAVISEDEWFMDSPAPEQLMAACVFRGVETGLPVVRAASTGISMITDSHGNVTKIAPIGKNWALTQTIPLPNRGANPARLAFPLVCALWVFGFGWFRPMGKAADSSARLPSRRDLRN